MKKLNELLVKNDKWLLVLFFFSLIFAFLHTVILSYIPEVFRYGARIGNFVVALCYSFIVSYIFYFVAFRVDRANKKSYNSHVIKKSTGIVNSFLGLLGRMGNKTNLPYETPDDIRVLLDNIILNDNAMNYVTYDEIRKTVVHGNYYTWAEIIDERNKDINKLYIEIIPFLTVIDVRLTDAIQNIMNLHYFRTCELTLPLTKLAQIKASEMANEILEMNEKMNELSLLLSDIKTQYRIE